MNFNLVDHPLVKRDVTILRNVQTNQEQFRLALKRVSSILAFEVSKNFTVNEIEVKTPLEYTRGYSLFHDIVLFPVLRAGLSFVGSFLDIMPEAKVGHIGLKRDELTLKPIEYYFKTPNNLENAKVIILDPMLATGGSASAAISFLKDAGVVECIFACLLAAPEGVKRLNKEHPDVLIYGAALDREINEKGYILPGLGDAGDRTFGTL